MAAPPPNLQVRPVQDFAAFRARERGVLDSYGWVDKDKGVVHIPIEEAMRLVVERGLPAAAPADTGTTSSAGASATGAPKPAPPKPAPAPRAPGARP
jgi:hypothetical protein